MKIGFIADIHIKLGQKDVPVNWALNRYDKLFLEVSEYNESVDKWIIGGDIFDRVPSVEEMSVFFEFIGIFSKPTFIYSGNHEALKKNTTFLSYLKSTVKRINSFVEIIDDFYTDDDGVDYIPYNKLKEYNPSDIDFHGDILCTHVRGEIPPHVKPEVNLELFSKWKVVLAGDLHSYDNCQRNILYPGSPVTTSFHRAKVDTGFIIIDTDTLEHEWIRLETVPQLLKLTIPADQFHTIKPARSLDDDHVVYEIEGNMAELSSLQDNELVTKKVTSRNDDTALLLLPTMTITQEVEEYLRYILLLEDAQVDEIMKELLDVSAKIEL